MSTYRFGNSHSINGARARDMGAMAWTKLPSALRRGLSSKDAEALEISWEWHHASRYANRVYVYYIEQVETFWGQLDAQGVTADQLKNWKSQEIEAMCTGDPEFWRIRKIVRNASEAAETVRENIEENY